MTTDPPAAGERSEPARPPPVPPPPPPPLAVDHMPLDDMEVRLEAVRFLTVFTAAWLIYAFFISAFAARSVPRAAAEQLPKVALVLVIAMALFACLRALGTARPGAAFAAAIFLAVLVVAKNLLVILYDVAQGREPTGWSLPLASIGFVYITYQVLRIGWIARRTPASGPAAVAAVPKARARIADVWLQVLGIPPIWRWLASWPRKAGAFVLFALAMLLFSAVVFLIMGELTSAPLTVEQRVSEAQACLRVYGSADNMCGPYAPYALWTSLAGVAGVAGTYALIFCIVGGLRYAARRFATLSLARLLSRDRRPAILFLRSFRDDQVRLARPRRRLFFRIVAFGEPRPMLDHILLEEATPYGPVIAIGAPGSRPPFGAARQYVTDDQWQELVRGLANDAGHIVVALDETQGVSWEVETLFAAEHLRKTLFLLPPRLTAPPQAQHLLAFLSATTPAMKLVADTIAGAVGQTQRACIGWYRGDDGVLHLMTTARPSHLSYVLAVRIFVQAHT